MLQALFSISILYRPTNLALSLPGLTAHCLNNAQSHSPGPLGSSRLWSWTISPVFHLVLPALYFLSPETPSDIFLQNCVFLQNLCYPLHPDCLLTRILSSHFLWLEPLILLLLCHLTHYFFHKAFLEAFPATCWVWNLSLLINNPFLQATETQVKWA